MRRKLMLASLVLLIGVGLGLGRWAGAVQAQGAKAAVVWPAGDIKWADSPAMKGAKIAVLWGDPMNGAYGALKMIPAGMTLGLHTHTHDQRLIEVAGTITLTIGDTPKEIGPGSYAFIPGGTKHNAMCNAGADCTYFEEQTGKSDFKPATMDE